MFRSYIVSHLADLVDAGVEECLDRVQGVGASGVSVAVTSGALGELRSAAQATPRVFRSRGGFFFQPNDEYYGDTRLKPIVSTWLKGRNPLEKVVDACRRRGLELRRRLSAFEVGRIARRYPEAAAQTVFGDPAPTTLCPASPDVRALLRATVDDLSKAHAPTAI